MKKALLPLRREPKTILGTINQPTKPKKIAHKKKFRTPAHIAHDHAHFLVVRGKLVSERAEQKRLKKKLNEELSDEDDGEDEDEEDDDDEEDS